MAKRFTDTDKWKRPWFRGLSNDLKVVWFYLLDQCDHAGVWCADFALMEFQTGVAFKREQFEWALQGKVTPIDADKYFIPSFIEFQYGELNPENNAHKGVLKIIEKLGANEPLNSPSRGAQDKDKEQEQEKGKARKPKQFAPGFEEVYDAYPNKKGKTAGQRKYEAQIKTPEDRERLILAVKNYAAEVAGTDKKYIKHFSTFMNCWEDYVPRQTEPKKLKTVADLPGGDNAA